MTSEIDGIPALALLAGIEPEYLDAWGQHRSVSEDTKRKLLRAMGIGRDDASVENSAHALDERAWRRGLEAARTVFASMGAPTIPIFLPSTRCEQSLEWVVEEEDGRNHRGRFEPATLARAATRDIDGTTFEQRDFPLPVELPLGYHHLRLYEAGGEGKVVCEMSLIVVPDRCYHPPGIDAGDRCWAMSVQLYGLRSRRNWGIGDFTDLAFFAKQAAALGASAVGVNPLHSLFLANPSHSSPYSPSSRLALNALYVDVETVPDFVETPEERERVASADFQRRLHALRQAPLVDYEAVAACKLPVLESLYHSFRRRHLAPREDGRITERGRQFRGFEAERGVALERLAVFQALSTYFRGYGVGWGGWRDWPSEYHDPELPAVRRFARQNAERVEFFKYLQWQAELQLSAVARQCRENGMEIGLYLDLAVGLDGQGGEAWSSGDSLALGTTVGAPPDPWNLKGQNWGQPPLNPMALRETAYAPFIATLRANMREAGALRIDHVLGLKRLFWIPEGDEATEGGYVRYPMEDLFGILALESVRNQCMVVGEDLGTVPEGFREQLWAQGILSYRLFYFERAEDGSLLRPADYPALAAVAIGTHDLPPFGGYWSEHDIEVKRQLNLFPTGESEEDAVRSRADDRRRIVDVLMSEGLIGPDEAEQSLQNGVPSAALVRAIHEFLARTSSRLLVVQPEDIIGVTEQANMPGTWEEHPNWRRRLPVEIEELFQDDRVLSVARAIRAARGDGHE